MTMEQLSEQTNIHLKNLQNLDNLQPDPWDYEDGGLIDRLAKALNMNFKELASAYARQEPPAYEGPTSTVEEDFSLINGFHMISQSAETIDKSMVFLLRFSSRIKVFHIFVGVLWVPLTAC